MELETKDAISRMSDMMTEKQETIIEISEIQATINELQKQLDEQNEHNVLEITSNNYLTELRNNIIEYQMQLEEALVEKKRDHPDVKILEQKLAKAKAELNREVLLSKKYSTELLKQKRNLAALKSHMITLNKEIDNKMADFSLIPDKNFINAQLQADVDVNKELYQSMLESLYQIRVAQSTVFSDLRIIEEATVKDIEDIESPSILLNSIAGPYLE